MSDFDDDDIDDESQMPCEVCGDDVEYWELQRCDDCDWLMCDACESSDFPGVCANCATERKQAAHEKKLATRRASKKKSVKKMKPERKSDAKRHKGKK